MIINDVVWPLVMLVFAEDLVLIAKNAGDLRIMFNVFTEFVWGDV